MTISMVMIVRDEERCIARALSSVASHVDELVVVDTGSIDKTVDIARSFGARMGFFEWCDDFATAKNYALELASCAVRLILDADEWVESGGPHLRHWAASHSGVCGLVACVSAFDAGEDVQRQRDLLPRLLPESFRYAGSIHEQVVGDGPHVLSPVTLGHDGYRRQQLVAKAGRNEGLLRAALRAHPTDGYLWYQLGVALATYDRHDEAIDAFEKASIYLEGGSPQQHPLSVRHLYSLGKTGRIGDALRHYERALAMWSESPDLHFVMADVLLDHGVSDPRHAEAVVPVISRLLTRCLEVGERPDLPGAVSGRGSSTAAHNLALIDGRVK